MKETIEEKIQFARASIIIDLPFFGSLLVSLRTVENKMIPSFRMDGEVIEYNGDYVNTLTKEELRTVICECILHGALGHIFRMESREPIRYNHACDYAVANIMRDSNMHALKPTDQGGSAQIRDYFKLEGAFKGWCPKVEEFDNLSAEEIYNLLPPTPPGKGQPGSSPGKQKPKNSEDDEEEQEPPPAMSPGEIAPAKGDKAEQEQLEDQWKVKVIQAANVANSMGKLPELLQRLVDDISAPRVPWRDQLRQFFNVRQRDEYSWKAPRRSLIHRGLYMPSLDSVRMGPIVLAVDTSGSVNDEILRAFQSEVQAVLDECMPERLIVIYCDAEVNLVKEYKPGDMIELKAVGGGGTDFQPVFRFVETSDFEPACLVYLTDLMGRFPKEIPVYPVLWGCVIKDVEAPFGETIFVDANN